MNTSCLGLNAFSVACYLWYDKITFTHPCIVTMDIFLLPCHFTCVKLDFNRIYCLKMDVFHLPCNSRCLKLNFVVTYILKLDRFRITRNSRSFKFNFWHLGFLILNLYCFHAISCYFWCDKLNFANYCSFRLDV